MAWLGRRITTPTLLVAAALVWFVLLLGCATAAGELLGLAERPDGSTAIDRSITSWVVAHRTQPLTTAGRFLSTVGSQAVLIPLIAIAAAALLWRRRFVLAAWLAVTWGGAVGLYSLTKDFVLRLRPPPNIWLTHPGATSAFPSGHATQSLATFLAVALIGGAWLPRVRWPARVIAVVLATGVGWSRVYLGVHWATDVGAGWLVAAAWVTVAVWLARRADALMRRAGGREG